MMTTLMTAKWSVTPKAPMATMGDLAASSATLGDVDNKVDDVRSDGGIGITSDDDGGSRGITCHVGCGEDLASTKTSANEGDENSPRSCAEKNLSLRRGGGAEPGGLIDAKLWWG